MIFGLFERRARAAQRPRGTAVPGIRRLALSGSAAGVVVVAAGVAILAAGGNHQAPHTPAAHLGVAGITLHHDEVTYPSAAYPPHDPCSLSLVRAADGSSRTTVEGDGLGAGQTVTVDYYSDSGSTATFLGSWRADRSGSFTASVDVPGSDSGSAVVTAQSPSALCAAPRAGVHGYPPTTGTPTTSPPAVTTPPTTTPPTTTPPTTKPPTTGGAPTSGGATTSSGIGTTGSAGTSNGATAPGGSGPGGGSGGGPGDSGQPTGGAPSSGASTGSTSTGGTASEGAGGPSSSGAPTGSSHPTAPTATSSPSPTTTQASLGAQSWGLPTSFIVTMALVLLVLGGLAVLVLTRRSS